MTSFDHVMIPTRGNWFQTNLRESDDRAGNTVSSVSVTNGKDMALQRQIWSTFVTLLWFRKTEIQDRARILVLVRVLWVTISKIYWQFWHSFFKYTFKSSSNFYPTEITWRKMARSICLKPVSMERRLHTLWRFTVPAYTQVANDIRNLHWVYPFLIKENTHLLQSNKMMKLKIPNNWSVLMSLYFRQAPIGQEVYNSYH